jgi:hypothetical protein
VNARARSSADSRAIDGATHAIARQHAQRLLARVDGQGVVCTGEFALSRLTSAIVEFYLEDDVLTRASLTVLTTSLRTALADVLATAREVRDLAFLTPSDRLRTVALEVTDAAAAPAAVAVATSTLDREGCSILS